MLQNLNEVETAWCAALLEGEGSFTLGAKSNRVNSIKVKQLRITCAMTDLDVLETLKMYSGIGNINGPRIDKRRPNSKPLYTWSATKRAAVQPFLQTIRPFMGLRRGAKIDELLKYAEDNPLIYGTVRHGTRNEYRKGCKCDPCMEAMRSYARDLRARKKLKK